MATKGHKKLNSIHSDEHDIVEYRKRVATHVDGNLISYEDTAFSSGDDASVLDVQTDLGRRGHRGYFINDGPGDVKIELSFNGTDYGGQHTLRGSDVFILDDLNVNKIRLTYVDDSEYRCLVG